ncbi:MAG: hypothetical protein M3Q31_15030 [Actinomycetota bacterium]|nr:hypothetical protein [Actinomycetota bacterium]
MRGEGQLAIVGARLLDGGAVTARENVSVLVRDGVVAEVLAGAELPAGFVA